jgi:hypothetical protein
MTPSIAFPTVPMSTFIMSDYKTLNSMSREELLQFARFAYTAYPTLLETHEKRIAFFRDHPDKSPYRNAADQDQMELSFTQEVDESK